jgi:hypothetical protein
MAVVVTVNGVDRSQYLYAFDTEAALNEHGVATVTFLDKVATWHPNEFDAIAITVDGTSVFNGTVLDVDVGWFAEADYVGLRTTARVADRNHVLNRQMFNTVYPANTTLKAILQDVVALLDDDWPVTLHPSQDVGPTFTTPITFAWMTLKEVLDYLADLTGRVYRIDEQDRLRMWAIGTLTAPVVFSDANKNILGLTWRKEMQSDYTNATYVQFGPTAVVEKTERQYGDGSTRVWTLKYAINQGDWPHTVYDSADDAIRPVAVYPDPAYEWTYEAATNQLHQRASDPVLTSGQYWEATYQPGFPQVVLVADAAERTARGIWVRKVDLPDVTDVDEATAYGQALNAKSVVRPRRIELRTAVAGNDPGEVATVNVAALDIASGSYLIERSRASYQRLSTGLDRIEFTLSMIGGNVYAGSWMDYWRDLRKGGASSSGAASGGGGVSGGTAAPGGIGVPIATEENASIVPGTSGQRVRNAVRIPIDASKVPGGAVTVTVRVRRVSGSGTLTPQLRRVSDGAVVGSGSATSSSTFEQQTFAATVSGVDQYELWLVASDATTEGIAVGTIA